ncbi:hypothetical protein EB796_015105 [Bugula neritina]|uniref:Uncharacterized protein n=1 Tax=Bugula neritina TaxID=10212 RepID=A0A7J7JLT6_BUGNE|nr:hypothetical protein EB796_015105 [Bugula neritina]
MPTILVVPTATTASQGAKEAAAGSLLDQLTLKSAGAKLKNGEYEDFYVELPSNEPLVDVAQVEVFDQNTSPLYSKVTQSPGGCVKADISSGLPAKLVHTKAIQPAWQPWEDDEIEEEPTRLVGEGQVKKPRPSNGYEYIDPSGHTLEVDEFTPLKLNPADSSSPEGRVRFASGCGGSTPCARRQTYARRQSPYPYDRRDISEFHSNVGDMTEIVEEQNHPGTSSKRPSSSNEERKRGQSASSVLSRHSSRIEQDMLTKHEQRQRAQSTYGRGRFSMPYELEKSTTFCWPISTAVL